VENNNNRMQRWERDTNRRLVEEGNQLGFEAIEDHERFLSATNANCDCSGNTEEDPCGPNCMWNY